MADIANGVCPGLRLTFESKNLTLAPADRQDIQGFFEKWMERRALEKLRETKPFMTEAEYEKAFTGTRRDISTGLYSWLSETWLNCIQTPPALAYMTFLCLKANHPEPEIDEDFAKRLFLSNQEEIVAHIVGTSDPNRKRPAATAAPASAN